jgi:RNA polymerase sigma factor (TIGR02999 family)
MTNSQNQLTKLLTLAGDGDRDSQHRLWTIVYDELRGIARHQSSTLAHGQTIQPTEVVHEAWFKLFGDTNGQYVNRKHFFYIAAKVMRHIRIDDVRRRKRAKRGGNHQHEQLKEEPPMFEQDPAEVMAVHEALEKLEVEDARKAEVVTLRYFAGLSTTETANALGVSKRTVQNDWRLSRAWLYKQLSDDALKIYRGSRKPLKPKSDNDTA